MTDIHDLHAEGQALVRQVIAFVDDEVVPAARRSDAAGEYPEALVARMKQIGLFRSSEMSLPVYAMIHEEIGRGWISLAPILNAHGSMVWAITSHGTAEQREKLLPELLTGDRTAALALSEPAGGTDLGAVRSTAIDVGGKLKIDAHKTFITHSRHADLLLMLVRTDSNSESGHRGLSLVILESGEWEVVRDLGKLGSRAVETCELRVTDQHVPVDRIVGGVPGRGFAQVMDCLEVGRIAVAAAAIGVGRAALHAAAQRSTVREAFGKPIADFQNVTTALGKAAIRLKAARALLMQAVAEKQRGGRHDAVTSAAKVFAAETAVDTALAAMEIHGGSGYLTENDPERFLRDATLYLAGEGANSVLTDLVGRRLVTGGLPPEWI
ncbi:acyl-CoA dehydrogenase family protein [Saccharopolyspora pogona]|uniref:acyl-CoA dehydrogenase family protein n=1 Tax=Saccharopolyspora pogona TaxID=333966 RepID=UPI001689B51F|nr:acyl-CoA dehydrogenase family protein [Saccharopolyspora pogona]